MEKDYSNENFNSSEENVFQEFKFFKAEEYRSKETLNKVPEFSDIKEVYDEIDNKKTIKKKSLSSLNNLKKSFMSHTSSIVTTSTIVIGSIALNVVPGVDIITNESKSISINENTLNYNNLPNKISINGFIDNYDSSFSYYADTYEYIDNELKYENKEIDIAINNEDNSFDFTFDILYGLTAYKYNIYYVNKGKINYLYESDVIDVFIDQAYHATYDKIKPNEAKINISDNMYQVEINTNFETIYQDIYSYKLLIKDEQGNVYNEYQGTDKVIALEIPYIEKMYFEYIDIGAFKNDEHIYNDILLEDYSLINIPSFNLEDEFSFDGQHFILNYNFETVYDMSNVKLKLELDNTKHKIIKEIIDLKEKGSIVLDDFIGEINNLKVSGELTFKDNMLDPYEHMISIKPKQYQMDYRFDITKVTADLTKSGSDYIDTKLEFDYLLPYDYKLSINNELFETNNVIDLTKSYVYSNITSGDGGTIDIKVLDSSGNIFKDHMSINVYNYDTVSPLYVAPNTSSNVNPYSSVITFNDDNTFNLYRDMNFTTSNENIYYDSLICSQYNYDTGEVIEGINHLTNEKYSIMEDIPYNDMYLFVYYRVLKYENVYYYLESEIPSGSIAFNELNVSLTYDEASDISHIVISSNRVCEFKNEVIIGSDSYQFDEYDTFKASLSIKGDVSGKEITYFFNEYLTNYDEYLLKMNLKGNKYKGYKQTLVKEVNAV